MKYIRTKNDTIYQVYDKIFEYKGDKRYQLVDSRFEISLNDIVKEADTIGELCDLFILKNPKWKKPKVSPHLSVWRKPLNETMVRIKKEQKIKIFGAIWSKGKNGEPIVITVAEINEKGELELL